MFGISYGELFLILGATAAAIGPKDLPRIARTAGRLAGRAIGYVQLARGQFESVMQHSQASKVHKELQDTLAQLEAIRYEIRSVSLMNPTPFTRRLDNVETLPAGVIPVVPNKPPGKNDSCREVQEIPESSGSSSLYSQAMTYSRLADASIVESNGMSSSKQGEKNEDQDSQLSVLPVSAESAGLLPKRSGEPKGSDIVLEAILEAEVAKNAKLFFLQPENQIHKE